MTNEELNFIKDSFSQIIDDIAGNSDWGDAAKAVASNLGTLERELGKKVTELPSNLDEAAEEIVKDWNAYGNGEYKKLVIAGIEWMSRQGFSFEDEVGFLGSTPFLKDADFDILDAPESFTPGDKVIVQIRKK